MAPEYDYPEDPSELERYEKRAWNSGFAGGMGKRAWNSGFAGGMGKRAWNSGKCQYLHRHKSFIVQASHCKSFMIVIYDCNDSGLYYNTV
jgi:hypothetical protein